MDTWSLTISLPKTGKKALYYTLGGWALSTAGVVLLLAGGIKGLNQIPLGPVQRLTFPAANWIYQNLRILWLIAPFPKPQHLFSFIGWVVWSYGLLMLGTAFRGAAKRKRERIDKAEDALRYQQTTYQQNIVQAQTIGAVNISQMLQQDKKGWWTKPAGIILLGVVVQILGKLIAKFFQLN
jgi:hypothetical protein